MPAAPVRALIDGGAGKIEVAYALPEVPRAVAVVAHPHPLFGGTMENKVVTTVAKAFLDAGAATYRFNFRGVGATQGPHDEGRGETDDLLQVIEFAHERYGALPVWLSGFSFGGGVALRASATVDFAQLVLVAPSFRRLTGEGLGEPPSPDDPLLGSSGRHTTTNTVVIHGDKDETVPLSDSINWAAPRDVAVVVVPGADHFFHRKLHVIREAVGRWVKI